MARLVYGTLCSLDGYAADVDGHFDWSAPDPEVHAFVNTLEAEIGTAARNLAAGELDKLATRERYLQLKYQGIEGEDLG